MLITVHSRIYYPESTSADDHHVTATDRQLDGGASNRVEEPQSRLRRITSIRGLHQVNPFGLVTKHNPRLIHAVDDSVLAIVEGNHVDAGRGGTIRIHVERFVVRIRAAIRPNVRCRRWDPSFDRRVIGDTVPAA